MDKNVRLSGIAYESLVNGPGMRRVFFAQGCIHKCKGCFNPDTHSFESGKLFDMDELLGDFKKCSYLKGATFSGGDPWEQANKFAYMAEKIQQQGKNIWCYTGYTYEYILENLDKREGWKKLLYNIDVLVDGKFVQELHTEGLKFRGSSNQRIIDVKQSIKENKVILVEKYK